MWLIFRIRPKARDIIAALVVVAGIAIFFLDNLSEGQMIGNILAILAGVTFSLVFVSKQMKDAVPIEALQLSLMINSIVGLPFAFTGGASADPLGWGLIIFLGIFQIGVAFIFFARGLEIVPPLSALLISTLEPILNPIWVMLIYGEVPGTFAFIGAVIVIVSVLTYNIIDMKKSASEQIKISEQALPNELN
jgi:drug/metabolite transporter (DMT)-like permease